MGYTHIKKGEEEQEEVKYSYLSCDVSLPAYCFFSCSGCQNSAVRFHPVSMIICNFVFVCVLPRRDSIQFNAKSKPEPESEH